MKPEILELREESDEIQDLSTRANGLFEGEESKSWREVLEALSDGWHESGYFEKVYSEVLEVRECGKVTQCALAKPRGRNPGITNDPHADPESFDEWEQTKLV